MEFCGMAILYWTKNIVGPFPFCHISTQNLRRASIMLNTNRLQKLKELVKLSNLRNFWKSLHSKTENCWMGKALMSHTSFVKFRVSKTALHKENLLYRAQISGENSLCHTISWSIFGVESFVVRLENQLAHILRSPQQLLTKPFAYSGNWRKQAGLRKADQRTKQPIIAKR